MSDAKMTNEQTYYNALKRIAHYQTVEQLRRTHETQYGLDLPEVLEMAYENIIEEAKAALRWKRKPKKPSAAGHKFECLSLGREVSMKPSIGRIVHYRCREGDHNSVEIAAAIITRVWSDTVVNLTVFFDTGAPTSKTSVPYGVEEFTWAWPERV